MDLMRKMVEDSYRTADRVTETVKLAPSRSSKDMRSTSCDGSSPGEILKQREPHSYNVTPGVLTSIVKQVRKTGNVHGREELANFLKRSV